jgi:hypothetical protein
MFVDSFLLAIALAAIHIAMFFFLNSVSMLMVVLFLLNIS